MNDVAVTFIGMLAATLTTVAYVPQVLQTYRTRSAAGLSLPMLLLFSTGVMLWLVYGLLKHDPAIIAANGLTLLLTAALVVMKLRFGPGGK